MAEAFGSAPKEMRIQHHLHDLDSPVEVSQDTEIGRGLLVRAFRRRDGMIKVVFMGQQNKRSHSLLLSTLKTDCHVASLLAMTTPKMVKSIHGASSQTYPKFNRGF